MSQSGLDIRMLTMFELPQLMTCKLDKEIDSKQFLY